MTNNSERSMPVSVPAQSPLSPRTIITILVLTVLVRSIVLLIVIGAPQRAFNGGDSYQYTLLATNIVEHGTFSLSKDAPFTPDIWRTPAYPALLAVLYVLAGHQFNALLIVVVQIILATLNVYLVLQIGMKLTTPRISIIAGVLYVFAPASTVYAGLVMTETFFTTALLIGILFFLNISKVRQDEAPQDKARRDWLLAAAAGIAFGLAVYIRPIGLYFVPIPMLGLLVYRGWTRRTVILSLVIGIVFALTLFPWFARNYAHFHAVIFTSLANQNLLGYNVSSIEAQRQKIPLQQAKDQLWKEVGDRMQSAGLTNPDQAQSSKISGDVAIEHILAHPFAALLYQTLDMSNSFRPGYSMATLLLQDNASEFGAETQSGNLSVILKAPLRDKVIYLLFTVYYAALYFSLAVGLLILLIRRQWAILVICGLTAFWFMYAPGAAGNARFRVPVEGLLALMAAVAIEAAITRLMQRRTKLANQPA